MDTPEQNNETLSQDLRNKYQNKGFTAKAVIVCMILSLIFGAAGGIGGVFYFSKTPTGQKFFFNGSGGAVSQKVTLNEDSAIIDVVKKDSPAVVSIIISQDLNKIPGYGLNSQSPFDFFFNGLPMSGGSSSQQQPSTTPNVQEVGAGSGFFVSADGLILTNKHVVSDNSASYTVLTSDGKKYDAKVLAQDPVNDLAIVKVDVKNAPFLTLADSTNLQIGQRVIAIGNSLGQYQNTVTSGIISGIGRSITAGGQDGSEQLSGVIQTDAAINPGNSGGPLLNIEGQVIGINTAIDQQGQSVGFALPAGEAGKALAAFQKNGKITHPFLGVRYIIITDAIAQDQKLPQNYGALIVRGQMVTDFAVQPGSPADKAGLVENDIILEVAGQKVDQDHPLAELLNNYNPGDSVTLQVYHKGKTENVSVTLSESK